MEFTLKPAVWERDGDELYVMLDQREMRTLSDPDGSVEEILSLLSAGHHTAQSLANALARRYRDISADDVNEGIAGLDGLGMIEDAGATRLLSEWERERYFTNLVFLQSFATLASPKEDMQRRLMDANVLVLGTGGLGSTVLMHLTGAGVGRFTLVEHDLVEERNFSRQYVYRHADIGRAKVERAAEWVREYSPKTEVHALNRKITSSQDVAQLLEGTRTDLVIAAVDTPPFEIGSWINRPCVEAGVSYVRGGMGVQSSYFSVDPGRSPCVECDRLVMLGEQDEPGAAGAKWRLMQRLSQVNRGVGPIAGQVGALVAMEALRYLTGFARPVAAGVFHTFDLSEGGTETITPWMRHPDCPVCPIAGRTADATAPAPERQTAAMP